MFGTVGAIVFVVATVGTNLLHFQVGLGPLISNVIASIVATFVSFTGNRYWTFRHREGSTMAREYVVFFLLNALGLGIQLACIWFTYYRLGLHGKLEYNIALILGIGLGTLFRFWSYRKWVWLAPPAGRPAAPPSRSGPAPRWPPTPRPRASCPEPPGEVPADGGPRYPAVWAGSLSSAAGPAASRAPGRRTTVRAGSRSR